MLLLSILADAGGFDPSTLTAPLSAIISIGFATWYAQHVTTVVIPKMHDSHREEREKADEKHATTIREMLSEMKEQRVQYTSWMMSRNTPKGS